MILSPSLVVGKINIDLMFGFSAARETFEMKTPIVAISLCFITNVAFAQHALQYPPGTSARDIAINERAHAETLRTGGVRWCLFIDTRDPRGTCLLKQNLDFGGGPSGDGAGAGASAGAGAGAK